MLTIPDDAKLGDKYGPAMELTGQAEADAYFEACVQHNLRLRAKRGLSADRAEAEKVERANLGYYAGYYSHATRERVERLFRCAHPGFGSIAQNGPPTAEEAFEAGVKVTTPPAEAGGFLPDA